MTDTSQKRLYEGMFLVDTGDASMWDDLTAHLDGILARHGAEVIGLARWDERKLAYPIAKRKRGTYVLAFFALADTDGLREMERDCQLSEKVLRVLFLRADHFRIADMRIQLGDDIRDDVAARLTEELGQAEPAAAPDAEQAPDAAAAQ
jgi:small subunit ribosomal protein S6